MMKIEEAVMPIVIQSPPLNTDTSGIELLDHFKRKFGIEMFPIRTFSDIYSNVDLSSIAMEQNKYQKITRKEKGDLIELLVPFDF